MKLSGKHILFFSALALISAGFGMLIGCVHSGDSAKLCEGLDVQFKDPYEFVSEEDIRGFLDRKYGAYVGVRLDSLDLGRIEKMLEEKSVVMNSEAWTTRDGILHISIVQRAPALRFQRGEEGFYIDRTGYVFPLHKSYTAEVPVVEGAIPDLSDGRNVGWAEGVLNLTDYIASSKQWKDKVEKISVGTGGEVELKMKEGKERFIIGYPDQIEAKFGKIGKYYSHILPSLDNVQYKSVNLKYNKQIICRKDI